MGAVSALSKKLWLVAYDIGARHRLAEVHRYLKRRGMHLQYSVFAVEHNDFEMRDVLADLDLIIDTTEDDIRAYHIPDHCKVWILGGQTLPLGVELHGFKALKLMKKHAEMNGAFL